MHLGCCSLTITICILLVYFVNLYFQVWKHFQKSQFIAMTKIFPFPSLHLSLRQIDLSLASCQSRLLFWKFPFFSHVLQYTFIRIDDHIRKGTLTFHSACSLHTFGFEPTFCIWQKSSLLWYKNQCTHLWTCRIQYGCKSSIAKPSQFTIAPLEKQASL